MNLRILKSAITVGLAIITLSACVYRMDIPQGNRIDPETLEQLEIGMSRNQVEFLLGSPAVINMYRPNQWHYVYYLKTGKTGEVEKRIMTLTFNEELLAEIEGSVSPG